MDTWEKLREFSFGAWASMLLRSVLDARTPFSEFLKTTLHTGPMHGHAGEQALFPLPVPKHGIFERLSCGSRQRRRLIFDRAFHTIVMALNFWHADYTFVPVESLCRKPSLAQGRVSGNLRRIVKAFGSSSEKFQVPACGRRIPTLMALLADLSDLLTWEGAGGDPYFRSFPGAPEGIKEVVGRDLTRAEELTPYRSLDPSRLKLSGSAQSNPAPFLSDPLWMAYMEPLSLCWTGSARTTGAPNLLREDPKAVAGLIPVWDARGLLFIRDTPLPERGIDLAMRFFNCYKSKEVPMLHRQKGLLPPIPGLIGKGSLKCLLPFGGFERD